MGRKKTGGAKEIIATDLLNDVNAVVGLHIIPRLKKGSTHIHKDGAATTAADEFFLNIQGKGNHGSMPQNGIDPIVVGTQIINQLQTIPSRFTVPGELVVVTVGEFKSGDAPNIIPDKAYMSASIRTIQEDTRRKVAERIHNIIENTCMTYGASYDLNYNYSYPAVINDKDLSNLVMDSAKEVLGEDMVFEALITSASEDFAYYREVAPICFVQLGGGSVEDGYEYANHPPKFKVQAALNFLK